MDLPNRKSIRLHGYDYSQPAWYFITLCTQNRRCIFGNINGTVMDLNAYGRIVESIWRSLPERFPVELDEFQIMPNHVHFIIHIVGAVHEPPRTLRAHHDAPLRRPLLSQIIGYFKMNSAKLIHAANSNIDIWQRNYYEHIIRQDIQAIRESPLQKIREYVRMNPEMWENDRNNPNRLSLNVSQI